jgi:DNA-binding NarL/FixJ family response regulator
MSGEKGAEIITVVVVDDHPSYGHGLKALLETLSTEIRVLAVATDAEEGLRVVEREQPDVVLHDIQMPNREGVEAAKKICALFPSIKVVMLTVSEDPSDIAETVRAGARGYLSKQVQPEELISAVKAIAAGEVVLGTEALSVLMDERTQSPLGDSEIAILRLLSEGLEHARIANEMAMSESSLKRRIRDIERKLGVNNRIQAVAMAAKRGLI